MAGREAALAKLKELGINFYVVEHPAVFTIGDMALSRIYDKCEICKNLFLRDEKGKRHFLAVMPGKKRADLQSLARGLNCGKLSFASEKRLMNFLELEKGAVTPLAAINDRTHAVEILIDRELQRFEKLGVHPNDNTATVVITFADLIKYVQSCGSDIRFF